MDIDMRLLTTKEIFLLLFIFISTSDLLYSTELKTWFTYKEVSKNVYQISDNKMDNIYLVIGEEKALLIDTGRGVSNLKALVETLTDLPVTVVNTHAHGDHCAGNFQFEKAYMHPADFEMAEKYVTKESVMNSAKRYNESNPELAEFIFTDYESYKNTELLPVKEGFVFDLGERKLEVVETPGHTQGCICLIDKENKLLFSGDNNCVHIWLFMETSSPVEGYLESLKKLMSYSDYFDTIMPGHEEPMGKDYLYEVQTCVNSILDGSCETKPYQSFGDNVRHCVYKRATIAFNPHNLHNN